MRREDWREQFAARVPPWYDGYLHFVAINGLGLAGIAGCLRMLSGASWSEWLFVPGFFVFANFVEWWVHKGPLHHKWPGLGELYQRHAAEHHVAFTHEDMAVRDPRELKMVLFPPLFFPLLLLMTSPIPIAMALLGRPNLSWLFIASAIAYYLVYEWFHTVHHWPRDSRIGRSWFARLVRHHHTLHHDPRRMARGNFNVSFPLADRVLGTMLE